MMDNGKQKTAAKMGLVQAVLVALISGAFGLGGAYVQFAVKNPATASDVVDTFDRRFPVGTVISSMVAPQLFAELANDPGGFDPAEIVWVPADGRDVPGSNYARKVNTAVPDLRGMFLRGLNKTEDNRPRTDGREDPDGGDREPGGYQEDAIIGHRHRIASYTADTGTRGYRLPITQSTITGDWYPNTPPDALDEKNNDISKSETRPKNIAVYYYVKIN